MLRRRLRGRARDEFGPAALLAVLLTQKVASAAVSPVLISATVKTAVSGTAHATTSVVVSQNVLDLARETTGYSFWNLVKVLGLSFVILVSIVSIGRSQVMHALGSVIPGWTGYGSPAGGSSCAIGSPASGPAPIVVADEVEDSSDE